MQDFCEYGKKTKKIDKIDKIVFSILRNDEIEDTNLYITDKVKKMVF
jgi:hypothetical protein